MKVAHKEVKDIELTPDQQKALDNILDWMHNENGDRFKTLMGFAGTGKTTLLNEIAKHSKTTDLEVLFTATTNKAVKVLRSRIDHHNFSTIHSACNIKPKKVGKQEIFEEVTWDRKEIGQYDVIVVDESSMISSIDRPKQKSLLTIIKENAENYNVKILFCGDPAQLQPINEERSQCFEFNPEMLDTIIRHGDTIANKSKLVRENDEYVPSKELLAEPEITTISLQDIAKMFKDFRDDPDKVRMLCWTNRAVRLWNAKLRIADYGYKPEKPFVRGDIVIANEPCEVNRRIVMNNSEEGVVSGVTELEDSWFLQVDLFSGGQVSVRKIKKEYQSEVKDQLNEYANDKRWNKYWSLKKKYHDIRHCYAMTTHKSQGSTFQNVIIDIKDINLNDDNENRNQLVYVAMTRASEKVFIYQ